MNQKYIYISYIMFLSQVMEYVFVCIALIKYKEKYTKHFKVRSSCIYFYTTAIVMSFAVPSNFIYPPEMKHASDDTVFPLQQMKSLFSICLLFHLSFVCFSLSTFMNESEQKRTQKRNKKGFSTINPSTLSYDRRFTIESSKYDIIIFNRAIRWSNSHHQSLESVGCEKM